MVRPKGVEPLTARFVAEYSIQLSYGRFVVEAYYRVNLLRVNLLFNTNFNGFRNGGDGEIRTLDRV